MSNKALATFLLAGALVAAPPSVSVVMAASGDDKKHPGILTPRPQMVQVEVGADSPDIQPVQWAAKVAQEYKIKQQTGVAAGVPITGGAPTKITQADLVNSIDSKAVEAALASYELFTVNDPSRNVLAMAKERFPDIDKEIQLRERVAGRPLHEIQIVVDPTDEKVNANLVVTPKNQGRNFLILSNGFFRQIPNPGEQPVDWVAETVNSTRSQAEQFTGKIDQPTLNNQVTPEAIQAAIASGRLKEIPIDQLKAVPKFQFDNLEQGLSEWEHKSKFVVVVDTYDNDGASKFNMIITPRKQGVDVPESQGTQVNYLIVSQGARHWTRKIVEDERTFHEAEIDKKIANGELSSLLRLTPAPHMLTIAPQQDDALVKEADKIARLEKLPATPLILIDNVTSQTAPPMVAMGSMIKNDGSRVLFLAMNRSARKLYADTIEIDAVLAHEFGGHGVNAQPGQGGDLDPDEIARRHNLSPEAQRRISITSEEKADKSAVDLGLGAGLERAIKDGTEATRAATGLSQAEIDRLSQTNPSAHQPLEERIKTIRQQREGQDGAGQGSTWVDTTKDKGQGGGPGSGTGTPK